MNEELKKQIDTSPTGKLVMDTLNNTYKDAEREYAISCIEVRFEKIGPKLNDYPKLLERVKAAESAQAQLEETIDALTKQVEEGQTGSGANITTDDEVIKGLKAQLQGKSDDFDKVKKELDQKVLDIAGYNETITELEAKVKEYGSMGAVSPVDTTQLEDDKKELEEVKKELAKRIMLHELAVGEVDRLKSLDRAVGIGFFVPLMDELPDIVKLKMIISKEGELCIVTVYPEALVKDENFKSGLPPVNFKGTAEEMDTGFTNLLVKAVSSIASATTEIAEYEKSVELAKAKSEKGKNDKEALKVETETLEKELKDLDEVKNIERMLEVLQRLAEINKKKYGKKYDELLKKTDGNKLF